MGTVDGDKQLQVLQLQQQDALIHLLVQLLLFFMLEVE
jgi:hypothetical protein